MIAAQAYAMGCQHFKPATLLSKNAQVQGAATEIHRQQVLAAK